jgi:hypothetical protein
MWRRSPGKPEEAHWQHHSADHHGRQSLFRYDATLLLHLSCEARRGEIGHENSAEDDADGEREKWQRTDAEIPATLFLEGDWICFEEKVYDTINESHIEGNKEENRFLNEHLEGPEEVAG